MASIDFQSYFALLAAELPRFSVPGVGSFVWHVEKAHVDPKAGTVAPPRPTLKYEPGHRYQSDTIAFLQEYFGIPSEEAEALLKEIGRLASAYIRAANEMEIWKLGKLKKIGGIYKVELNEEAPIPIVAELYEVSLRSSAAAAAPVSISIPHPSERTVDKAKSSSSKSEASRARVVVEEPEREKAYRSSGGQAVRRWRVVIGLVSLLMVGIGVAIFWILRGKKTHQPVEIVINKSPSPSANTPSASKQPEEPIQSQKPSTSKPPAQTIEKSKPPTKADFPQDKKEVASSVRSEPTFAKKPSSGPRYHIIAGSYPSRAEAEAKARQFTGYAVEYLPGKEPGWIRLSIYSSTDPKEVQQKLREIKSQVPDAWVLKAE